MQHNRNDASPPLALSQKAGRTDEQPISYLIELAVGNPRLINLAAGLVDPLTLPVEPTRKIVQKLLSDTARGRVALQYGTTQGLTPLRQACLRHLERLEQKPATEMGLTADHLVVTSGSQQSLYLISDVLIDPGDIVIAANPSYFVYTGTLASFGANVQTVPMDDDGMVVEAVEAKLTALERQGLLGRVKVIYCTSYYQNPTGLTLSLQRRPKLLELARRFSRDHRILIVEDAAYRELRYDGPALPSIKSFDPDNRHVVLTQTFSKPFAPGLKTGYTAMPADLVDAVLRQKGNHDFGSGHLAQQIALEAMSSGMYHEHVELLQASYRSKRDAVLEALGQHMPPGVTWTRPHGGLYVWLTLPEGADTSRGGGLFERALAAEVLYVPGDYCMQPDETGRVPRRHIRLSFGQVAPEQIEPGIQRLAAVIREGAEG